MPSTIKTKAEIEQMIVSYLVNDLQAATEQDLDPDANLFAGGILDSISIMRLIARLEAALDIKIPPKDLVPRHFMTVKAMVDYLHQVTQPAP